jgi:hypothetical protein
MRVFRILPPIAFHSRKAVCQKSGQDHPAAREMFRAFFVAAGAKRKTSPSNMPVYPGALRIAVIRWSPASVQ